MLAEYLAQPGSTTKKAAEIFKCSVSLIEKTVARLRREQEEAEAKKAEGDVDSGHSSSESVA
jgi:transposase